MWFLMAACTPDPAPPAAGPTCAEQAPTEAFELAPSAPDTQIHAASALDSTGVWVVFNLPDPGGLFDVWATHIACDGTVDVEPVQIDTSDDNEIDPSVAVFDNRVLVAWQSDNASSGDNLDVRWRILDPSGSPQGPVREADIDGNAWMPAVAAGPQGFALALAGSNGTVFAGHWAELDRDGAPMGTFADFGTDPGGGEFWPSVTIAADGEVHAAWEGDTGVGTYSLGGGADLSTDGGLAPSISAGTSAVWVAYGDGEDVRLGPLGEPTTVLKGGPKVQFGVAVAAGEGGGHAAWYVNVSGLDNEIQLGRFDADGALLDSIEVSGGGAPPYAMNLTRIDDDTVFLAWQEGSSPAFRLRGQFLTL